MPRMMLVLEPDGFECTLDECPPGLFLSGETVCLKTEYGQTEKGGEAYLDSGEYVAGPAGVDRELAVVKPLKATWKEVEE